MPDSIRLRRLLEWSLAAFHAGFLFAALITVLYAGGSLGSLLGSLNTFLGIGLYAIFWLSTWWTTRRATSRLALVAVNAPLTPLAHLGTVMLWAAVNGLVLFLTIVFLIVANTLLLTFTGQAQLGDVLGFAVTVLAVGAVVSAIIGAVAGLLFALLDSLLLALARWLVPAPSA
jgi:hypothetical protein